MFRKLSLVALLVAGVATTAEAQISSTATPIALAATKAEALSLTVTGALTAATITENAATPFGGSLSLSAAWDLLPSRGTVTVIGYISKQLTAVDGVAPNQTTSTLPNTYIEGEKASASGTWNPFSGTVGGYTSAWAISTITINGLNRRGTATESIALRLNTPNTSIVPGSYTGELTLIARAQ